MKLYAKGPVDGSYPPQVGVILKKSVSLTGGNQVLVEVSGTSECDWNNRSQSDNTHCFISAHIQNQNTRPGTIPSWCDADTDVMGYGEQSNRTFLRESQHSFNLNSICTPPSSGTYDVVVYGHVVAGDNSADSTKLDVRQAKYNIIG